MTPEDIGIIDRRGAAGLRVSSKKADCSVSVRRRRAWSGDMIHRRPIPPWTAARPRCSMASRMRI